MLGRIPYRSILAITVLLVLGAAGSVQAWPPAADYAGEAALQQRVLETYGRLPLYFIERQGQLDERVA